MNEEIIKNLDFLLAYELLEKESEWDFIEAMQELDSPESEDQSAMIKEIKKDPKKDPKKDNEAKPKDQDPGELKLDDSHE